MDLQKLEKNTLILDFDGTICRLFEKYDLESTKELLKSEMKKYGLDLNEPMDCFDIFDIICKQFKNDSKKRKSLLLVADGIISEAECRAVENCIAVEYFDMLDQKYRDGTVCLAIASNNSEQCIKKYLKINGFSINIPTIGRDCLHPEHMKPNPWTISETMKILDIDSSEGIFIGDTINDLIASQKLNMDFIGMVPTDKKRERLYKYNNDILMVSNYKELLSKLYCCT